jgi:hypothetical protein
MLHCGLPSLLGSPKRQNVLTDFSYFNPALGHLPKINRRTNHDELRAAIALRLLQGAARSLPRRLQQAKKCPN